MDPQYGCAKVGRPARTYIQQLCEDTGCNSEDLPEAMNDRRNGERGSGISALAARHDDDDDDIPTPPHAQDVTQGQFSVEFNSEFSFS